MARNNTQSSQVQTREFRASEFPSKVKKSIWNKVGVAWMHRDENGYILQLESLFLGGRVVIRHPHDDDNGNAAERT